MHHATVERAGWEAAVKVKLTNTVAVSVRTPDGWETASTRMVHCGCEIKSNVEHPVSNNPVVLLIAKQETTDAGFLTLSRYKTVAPASCTHASSGVALMRESGVLHKTTSRNRGMKTITNLKDKKRRFTHPIGLRSGTEKLKIPAPKTPGLAKPLCARAPATK